MVCKPHNALSSNTCFMCKQENEALSHFFLYCCVVWDCPTLDLLLCGKGRCFPLLWRIFCLFDVDVLEGWDVKMLWCFLFLWRIYLLIWCWWFEGTKCCQDALKPCNGFCYLGLGNLKWAQCDFLVFIENYLSFAS